jgi:selT/selW/selH-like putative selenoprotein
VRVEIHYCPTGSGYDTRAASLAAELNGEGFDARAIPGGKGQFDVVADGRLVYSKRGAGRFPDDGEILAALRA